MVTIYALRNKNTGMSYIGCTAGKLGKRMREHRCLLRAGKHAEPLLQADWSKDGETAFEMIALEMLPRGAQAPQKRRAEMAHMLHFKASGRLYNTRLYSHQPPPGASALAAKARVSNGYVQSAETRRRRSETMKGRRVTWGAKISAGRKRRREEIVCATTNKEVVEFSDKEPRS